MTTATKPCCGFPNSTHYAGCACHESKPKVNRGAKPWLARCDEAERFAEYVSPEPNSGCHLWTGSYKSNGYGQFCFRGKTSHSAPRAAWILANGPIPNGLNILHRCDNRACVNVAHLFLGTQRANVQDMIGKGRDTTSISATNRERTSCPNGHAYDMRDPNGARRCRQCYLASKKRRRARSHVTEVHA